METCPDAVAASLRGLSERLKPRAEAELASLRETKRKLARGGGSDASEHAVQPWDLSFLMAEARKDAHGSDEQRAASEYLELEASLAGLELVLKRAFGLSLSPLPAAEGELWHQSVRKLLLSRLGGPALGVLYLDLFPRHGKTTQAGLYTLRGGHSGGRRGAGGGGAGGAGSSGSSSLGGGQSAAGSSSSSATVLSASSVAQVEDQLLMRHLPAAALICALPKPRGAGCDPASGKALLTHRQLEKTLYHEMGHGARHGALCSVETAVEIARKTSLPPPPPPRCLLHYLF